MGRYAFAICLPDHTAILLDFKLAMQMLTGSRSGSSALGRPFTALLAILLLPRHFYPD
jgi:hypothetical protein